MSRADDLEAYVANFTRRLIQDALNEATADYWLRRARQFESVGTPSADEKAIACRNHSTIVAFENFDEIYDAVIAEPERNTDQQFRRGAA